MAVFLHLGALDFGLISPIVEIVDFVRGWLFLVSLPHEVLIGLLLEVRAFRIVA